MYQDTHTVFIQFLNRNKFAKRFLSINSISYSVRCTSLVLALAKVVNHLFLFWQLINCSDLKTNCLASDHLVHP